MTDHEFADELRAVHALRTGLRRQAERPAFRPLNVAELVGGVPQRGLRAGRWIGAVAAVAAIGIATTLLLPGSILGGLVPSGQPGTPASTSSPSPSVRSATFTSTAQPPLSPRREAVAAWVEDSFIVAGGLDGPPCPLTDPGETCDPATPLTDGARYTPTANTWTKIAEPAFALPRQTGTASSENVAAAVGRTLYVLSPQVGVAGYHLDTDSWEVLGNPPAVTALLSWDGRLIAYSSSSKILRYWVWDATTRAWTEHDTGLELPGATSSPGIAGDWLVVSSPAEENVFGVAQVNLATGKADDGLILERLPARSGTPVVAANRLVWPREGGEAPGTWTTGSPWAGWAFDPTTGLLSSVAQPSGPTSGLVGWSGGMARAWPVTTDDLVSLNGQLYDPARQEWVVTPPVAPNHDPIIAGGARTILVCFGYDLAIADYYPGCRLLTPQSSRKRVVRIEVHAEPTIATPPPTVPVPDQPQRPTAEPTRK